MLFYFICFLLILILIIYFTKNYLDGSYNYTDYIESQTDFEEERYVNVYEPFNGKFVDEIDQKVKGIQKYKLKKRQIIIKRVYHNGKIKFLTQVIQLHV